MHTSVASRRQTAMATRRRVPETPAYTTTTLYELIANLQDAGLHEALVVATVVHLLWTKQLSWGASGRSCCRPRHALSRAHQALPQAARRLQEYRPMRGARQ